MLTKAIEDAGFGISGDIGGICYQTYWTPDGRQLKAVPSIRDFVVKNAKGEITQQGTRDANLDKGWLLTKPTVLKIHCLFCDKWHDNEEEVNVCKIDAEGEKKKMEAVTNAEIEAYLKEQKTVKDTEISGLKKELAELKAMMSKLLKEKT